jgi:polyisoprenoid-binding protein YceI
MSALLDVASLAGTWELDVKRTMVEFHTKGLWFMNVTGTFPAQRGSVAVRSDGIVTGVVVFDAASIDTGLRRRDVHLRSVDFLDAANHPTVTFVLTNARTLGPAEADIAGVLTARGVARDLQFRAVVAISDEAVVVTAEVDLDRREWGMTYAKFGARFKTRLQISAHLTRISSGPVNDTAPTAGEGSAGT